MGVALLGALAAIGGVGAPRCAVSVMAAGLPVGARVLPRPGREGKSGAGAPGLSACPAGANGDRCA